MNKSLYFSIVLLACSLVTFGKPGKGSKPKFTPPGTKWVSDNMFVDKTEVTNTNWLEFYYWLNRTTPKSQANSMLPDSTVDVDFRGVLNREHPVTGISYEQAQAFCKWRTDRVNDFKNIKDNHLKWTPDSNYNSPVVVRYSIPTKQEWDQNKLSQHGFKCTAEVLKQ